jgi:phosphatidylglycerol:prolipoprotein diacylglycerol transferase
MSLLTSLQLPHPIVHHPFAYGWGPVQITGFGIAILMCFVVAQVVAQRELVRRGHDASPIPDMIFAALVGGLLGAKLYYVVILRNWDALFDRGGFVYWGGFIGGALAVTAVVLQKRAGFWKMADVSAPALAGAYAIGRTGCWAIGDDYGRPWNGFLAVAFPDGAPPSTADVMAKDFGVVVPPGVSPATVLSVYPTQLLEVTLGLLIFGVLWRLRDHRHAEGWLFGLYLALMGVERFLVEFLRAKDDRFVAGLTYAQVIGVAFVVIGVGVMTWRSRVGPGRRGVHAEPLAAVAEPTPRDT